MSKRGTKNYKKARKIPYFNMSPSVPSGMLDELFSKYAFVFIDAGYLSKLCKHFGKDKYLKLDILKFSRYLCSKINLHCKHIFYYTAPPFQSANPTKKEVRLQSGYDSFINKLRKNNGITIREGGYKELARNLPKRVLTRY